MVPRPRKYHHHGVYPLDRMSECAVLEQRTKASLGPYHVDYGDGRGCAMPERVQNFTCES